MWLTQWAACGVQIGSPADLVGVTQSAFARDGSSEACRAVVFLGRAAI